MKLFCRGCGDRDHIYVMTKLNHPDSSLYLVVYITHCVLCRYISRHELPEEMVE